VSSKALQFSTADAHEAIVEAIEARNATRAADAMLRVIEAGYDRIKSKSTTAKTQPAETRPA
jgi:DNA-binding GntR family transcriptional regulator